MKKFIAIISGIVILLAVGQLFRVSSIANTPLPPTLTPVPAPIWTVPTPEVVKQISIGPKPETVELKPFAGLPLNEPRSVTLQIDSAEVQAMTERQRGRLRNLWSYRRRLAWLAHSLRGSGAAAQIVPGSAATLNS
jgi:hypothetical protein